MSQVLTIGMSCFSTGWSPRMLRAALGQSLPIGGVRSMSAPLGNVIIATLSEMMLATGSGTVGLDLQSDLAKRRSGRRHEEGDSGTFSQHLRPDYRDSFRIGAISDGR